MRGKPKISNPELYRTIRRNIRAIMEREEIYPALLAEWAGMPEGTIRRYLEDSGQGMYVHVLHHIAMTLQTSIDALMEDKPCGQ